MVLRAKGLPCVQYRSIRVVLTKDYSLKRIGGGETERQRETERDRETESTEKDRDTQKETEKETERERQKDKERQQERLREGKVREEIGERMREKGRE